MRFIRPLALLLATAFPAVAQSPTVWRLANEYPANSLTAEGDQFFADQVAAALGDRVRIEPAPNAATGLRSREQLDAVATGRVAMATTFGGAIGEAHPLFALSSLPFLTPTLADARALSEVSLAALDAAFLARNQKLIALSPWPPSGLWSRGMVDAPARIAALRLRTYDATSTEVFRRLGATAEVVSFTDLEPRLASGSVDSVLSSGDGGAGRALWRFTDTFTAINYAVPLSFTTVNLDAWNALDPATRERIEAIGRATTARNWQAMNGRLEANYERMRANGMRIVDPVPEVQATLGAAGAAVVEQWAARAGEDGRAILAAFRARRGG